MRTNPDRSATHDQARRDMLRVTFHRLNLRLLVRFLPSLVFVSLFRVRRKKLQFSAYETSVSYLLNTTDDNVVETPDESLTVSIYVPGMFPSFLGDLVAVVEIEVRLSEVSST